MAQRRSNTPYIYDNTARDLQIRRQMEEPRRQLSHETRKNREKARHMSIGYVTFLMVALVACAFFLVNYIQMQSELTARITEVSRMESELNSLKLANDEEYSRITSNINLEESQEDCHRRTGNDLCNRGTGNHLMRATATTTCVRLITVRTKPGRPESVKEQKPKKFSVKMQKKLLCLYALIILAFILLSVRLYMDRESRWCSLREAGAVSAEI